MMERHDGLVLKLQYLAAGVISCGALGLVATFSPLFDPAADRVIGAIAFLTLIFAAIALRRRTWTRLPLLVACWVAWSLLSTTIIFPSDEPMDIDVVGYAFLNAVIVMLGVITLIISRLASPDTGPGK